MTFIEDTNAEVGELLKPHNIQVNLQHPLDFLDLLDFIKKEIPEGLHLGKNCNIGKCVVTKGPIIAGDNVTIADYAYLRGPVILGNDVHVSAEVKNAIILKGTWAAHRSIYIGDSLIGRKCNVGAGTQFANFRFDEGEIPLNINNQKLSSGRIKLGAIVEHNCKFGINAVVSPGKYIKEGTKWIATKPMK